MSILRKRLQDALENGTKLTIETASEGWSAVPIYLDDEWVEVLVVDVKEDDEGKIEGLRQTWLIRLDRIEAIAYPSEQWDAERLDSVARGNLD